MVRQALLEQVESPEQRVLQEIWVHQVCQGQLVLMETLADLALKDQQGLLGQRVLREMQETQVHRDHLVPLDHKVPAECRGK